MFNSRSIKLTKISEEHFSNLETSLNSQLNINNIQTYFPIQTHYFNFYNNDYSSKRFVLNSKFILNKLNDEIEYENNDSYIKFMYDGSVIDTYSKIKKDQKIFIKLAPILEVMPYLMNQYNTEHNGKTSNIFSFITNNKINSLNNSAYIDSFSSYALSRLTELGKCPTFPLFFGTYSGIAKNFDFDITDEYQSIKNEKWFKRNLNKDFSIYSKNHKAFDNSSDEFSDDGSNCDNTVNLDDLLQAENLDIEIIEKDLDNGKKSENEELKDLETENKELDEELETENKDLNEELDEDLDEDLDEELDENTDESSEWEDDDSVKTMSSIGSNLSDIENYKQINYIKLKNYPVQIISMELCDNTLDEIIEDENYDISNDEWKGILFQVCFGMAVAQKQFDFVHNDLHSSNIMFMNTEKEYIYYKFRNNYFRIPTYGKITKIIDFGRATFRIGDKLYFSDVFKKYGDAEGQYSYPYNNSLRKCKVKPNKSFDLARLSTTIVEHFEEKSELYNLMKSWATDKYGESLIYCDDDFDLYKNIAYNVCNSIPKDQLNKKVFKSFKIEEKDIPENEFIYIY